MSITMVYQVCGAIVVGCPALLLVLLGVGALPGLTLSERAIAQITKRLLQTGLLAALAVLLLMLLQGDRVVTLVPWTWVSLHEHPPADSVIAPHQLANFHFEVKFVFDRLSVPFVLLTYLLCSTIGAFAGSYMHREPGFRRFFLLFAVFLLGMIVSALAGSIETLFAGWELVGLSSALLIAFYHERTGPVRNALRVWCVYRIADSAFLVASITLHGLTGAGDFARLMGEGAWPYGQASMTSNQALFVGALLLVTAAGKSALIPFSGWLPRAMEGPTPSSAIFYGALSVHLGVFLLLRTSSILALSPLLSVATVVLGLATAGNAALVGRAQTDVKSLLSYASLTQVGLIVAEVGCGWQYLALIHMLGHACLRTLQLLRAPSLLLDYQRLESAVGVRFAQEDTNGTTPAWKLAWYRFAFARSYLDQALDQGLVAPWISLFSACNRWERRWTNFLAGRTAPAAETFFLEPEETR